MMSRYMLTRLPNSGYKIYRRNLSNLIFQQYTHLEAFPEYKEIKEFESKGQYARAIPLAQRIHEIASKSMGANHHLSVAASFRVAENFRKLGQYYNAENALMTEKLEGLSKAYALQAASACQLLNGYASEALRSSKEANQLAEQQVGGSSATDDTVFFSGYTMQGLAHLCLGEIDLAESCLQQAARWSVCNGITAELQAMSNLGALSWLSANPEVDASPVSQTTTGKPSLQTTGVNGDAGGAEEPEDENTKYMRNKVQSALTFWEEGVLCATMDTSSSSGSGSQASQNSMCGPSVPVTVVSNSYKSKDKDSPASEPIDQQSNSNDIGSNFTLASRLQNPEFVRVYVSLLSSVASAHTYLDNPMKANEYLATAVKAMDSYLSYEPLHPELGRLLGLIGRSHFSAGELTHSEGLFRSAVAKYNTPLTQHDLRHKYEKVLIEIGYGHLLSVWDKRKAAGEKMVQEAEERLKAIPCFHGGMYLPLMVQIPI